ncbi:MAG: hypothetical protein ABFS05_08510 [Bacteroidota bacterium]
METSDNITDTQPKRPQLLTILCILTFIGSGMGVIGFLSVTVNYEASMEALRTLYADLPEASFLLQAPRDFFLISFILMAFSVAGAVFMWNMRKVGFHLYTSAQLIYLALPFIYFHNQANPFLNVILTALFVYLYARNLQSMR